MRRGRAVRTLIGFWTRISPSTIPKESSFAATAVVRNRVRESGSLNVTVAVPSFPVMMPVRKTAVASKFFRTAGPATPGAASPPFSSPPGRPSAFQVTGSRSMSRESKCATLSGKLPVE